MKKVFVIYEEWTGKYYDGGKGFVMFKLCKEYKTPEEAELVLPSLPPGTYEIKRKYVVDGTNGNNIVK